MKFLADFFPVLLFFVAYKLWGIYVATIVAIGASLVQLLTFWIRHKRLENMHIITFAMLAVFGGLTLVLHNELFIKWKPTVINWLFAVAFLGSQFIGKKNFIQRLTEKNLSLPAVAWLRLNLAWTVFFVLLGFANLYVAYNFDTDTWVNFKMFGMMGLTLIFIVIQSVYIARNMQTPETNGS